MESENTLINTNTILEAISGLRQEMNERFNNVEVRLRHVEDEVGEVKQRLTNVENELGEVKQRLTNVEQRLTSVENDVREIKLMNVGFDARIDRLQSLSHESLQVGYMVKADVTILRAEVTAWTQDVVNLQLKVA